MRILVVDDEAPARSRLRRLLGAVADVDIVGEAANGDEAVERIAELAPDVVLLDIQMPKLDGFGVIDSVGVASMPVTILCTAHDEHALRAFEARAIDYLLKPVQPDRLADALARARSLLAASKSAGRARGLKGIARLVEDRAAAGERAPIARLLARDDQRAYLLPVERIDHIRADRNYSIVRSEGRSFRVRRPISALAGRLDPRLFLRIGKSDVVRLDAVREIQPWSHGDYRVVMRDGTILTWSRRYRAKSQDS
jgi:two-component system LytT family response regulator